jgi:predicted pyridoxine 5'-phosphate oxidase superfamily flavin-nucleotide-binding protein
VKKKITIQIDNTTAVKKKITIQIDNTTAVKNRNYNPDR